MSEQLPILHIRGDQLQLMLTVVAAARKYREVRNRQIGQPSEARRDMRCSLAWRDMCAALDAYEASIQKRYEDAITADDAAKALRRHGEEL